MKKLAVLYEYQQADAKLEAYEKKLKDTATRKQLVKLQNYLRKQQAVIKEMENKALVEQNELSEIDVQYDRLKDFLSKKKNDISEYEKLDIEVLDYNVVKDLVHDYETTYENIVKQKRRAVSVQKNAETTAAKLKQILVKVSKAQKEFAELKKKHEEELRAGASELEKLKKAAELAASKVDPELLNRYKRIKKNKAMPVFAAKRRKVHGMQYGTSVQRLGKYQKI